MRILVTGGSGFTGANLVRRLLGLGHEVTVLDIKEESVLRNSETQAATVIVGSVTDPKVVDRATKGQEIVFHIAAAFREISAPDSLYVEVNEGGTRNVLAAAQRNGVRRVIHCSTSGVHGGNTPRPWGEDAPIGPDDIYQQTKWMSEQVCQEFIAQGQDITIVRPTSEYGPGDTYGMRHLFRMAKKGRFIMFGSGKGTVHPIYIENLVDFFVLVMGNPATKGQVYLIADPLPITLNDLVKAVGRAQGVKVKITHLPLLTVLYYAGWATEIICKPLKISPPIFRRRVHWFQSKSAYSIARAVSELSYKPSISMDEGMRRTAAWYRENGYL